jgi:hypothetical protein
VQGDTPDSKMVFIKEVEKSKHFPKEIVNEMNEKGFTKFNMHEFLQLVKEKEARGNPQYSVSIGNRWAWYDAWIPIVEEHCVKKYGRQPVDRGEEER